MSIAQGSKSAEGGHAKPAGDQGTSRQVFVRSHHASELVFDKMRLLRVRDTMRLDEVLEVLAVHRVRAAPVYRKCEKSAQKEYIGIISSFDIISHLAFAADRELAGKERTKEKAKAALDGLEILQKTAGDLLKDLGAESSAICIFEAEDNVEAILKCFCTAQRGLVPQRDDKLPGKMTYRILTQSDVVAFLLKHESVFADIFNKPVEELNLVNPVGPRRAIHAIQKTEAVLDAFLLLARERIHAAPVIDDEGKVLSTISTVDTRGLTKAHLSESLLLPVEEFLKRSQGGKILHPLTAMPKNTLGEVMWMMKAAKMHRHQVWITSPSGQVLDVVSATDVIQKITEWIGRAVPPSVELV